MHRGMCDQSGKLQSQTFEILMLEYLELTGKLYSLEWHQITVYASEITANLGTTICQQLVEAKKPKLWITGPLGWEFTIGLIRMTEQVQLSAVITRSNI